MSGMTFRGIRKDYIIVLQGRKRPPWAPIQRNILTIPGMDGGYLSDTEVGPRPLEVPVLIKADSFSDLQKLKEDLAAWLVTDEPQELIFDDEPDRVYYAIVDSSLDLDELVRWGKGTIKFICPDPYKYSTIEKYVEFTNAASFNVGGTVETEPVITVEVAQDTTFLAVSNGEQLNMIGDVADVDVQPFEPKQRIFWSECNSLVGWTDSATVDGGTVAGAMKTDGYYFYSNDYGAGSQWHGPALKTSLSEPLQDFSIEAIIDFRATDPKQVGRIVITALDEMNQTVARMQFWRRNQYANTNYALFSAGHGANQKTIFHDTGDRWSVWNVFYGMLRIERIGNKWNVYVAQIDRATGKHHSRGGVRYWVDNDAVATNQIRQILVHVSTYSDCPACIQRIDDVKVFKINHQPQGVPIVAKAGDIIEFDHKNKIIRRNGEDITKEKAFIGEYFKLKPGQNSIVVEPSAQNVKVRWREKWR